jgi:hypothetical protein
MPDMGSKNHTDNIENRIKMQNESISNIDEFFFQVKITSAVLHFLVSILSNTTCNQAHIKTSREMRYVLSLGELASCSRNC